MDSVNQTTGEHCISGGRDTQLQNVCKIKYHIQELSALIQLS